MKRTVRSGCFETNSSSMHSIVVTNEDGTSTFMYDDWTLEKYGKYTLWDSDVRFGRSPFEVLRTVFDKARYAIADAGNDEKKVNSIISLVKEISGIELDVRKNHMIEFRDEDDHVYFSFEVTWVQDEKNPKMERPVLKKEKDLPESQQTVLKFNEWDEYPGYIDHQSDGLLNRFLAKEKIKLKDFLLNKKYFVIIDGDEYCVWDEMMRTGVIDSRKIDHIVF